MEASSSCQAQSYFMHTNPTFVYETSDNFYPGSGYPPQRPVLENLGPFTASPYRAGRDSYTAGQTPKPARPHPHFTHVNYQELPCHNGPSAYYDAPISPQTRFFDPVDKPDLFYPTPTPSPVLPPIHSAAYTTRRESTQAAGPSSYDVHWQPPAAPSLVERAGKRLSASRVGPYSPTHARHSIAAGYPYELPTHRKQSACEIVAPSRGGTVRPSGTVHNKEWGKLAPGQVHVIISNANAAKAKFVPNATVQDFAELGIPAEVVLYAPRSPKYLSLPNDGLSISFSVDGIPAPYIHQFVKSKVRLDGGHDSVFERRGWRTTKFRLVWAEFSSAVENIDVERPDKSKMTNDEFAAHVAACIWQIIRDVKTHKKPYAPEPNMEAWDLRTLNVCRLRLVAVNYFKTVWVPVLAVDMK